jgi:hypothetical protein
VSARTVPLELRTERLLLRQWRDEDVWYALDREPHA